MAEIFPTSANLGIVFKKLVRTCTACPSQWDAEGLDGTKYYIRFRWGHLTIENESLPLAQDSLLYEYESDESMDGWMTTADMLINIGCSAIEIKDQ